MQSYAHARGKPNSKGKSKDKSKGKDSRPKTRTEGTMKNDKKQEQDTKASTDTVHTGAGLHQAIPRTSAEASTAPTASTTTTEACMGLPPHTPHAAQREADAAHDEIHRGLDLQSALADLEQLASTRADRTPSPPMLYQVALEHGLTPLELLRAWGFRQDQRHAQRQADAEEEQRALAEHIVETLHAWRH